MPRAVQGGSDRPTLLDQPVEPAGLPRDLSPMRPRLAADAFNSPDHLFELKWDGIRALVSLDAGGLRVVDRNGGDLLPAVPELASLRLPEGTMLDGEIIVCDSRGRPSYDLLVGRALRAQGPLPLGPEAAKRGRGPLFVAFDLLYDEGRPLLGLGLEERRRRLAGHGIAQKGLVVPEHLENDGEPFLDVVAEYELEGIVAKRRDGKYIPGSRSADWLKCLVSPRADVVIGASRALRTAGSDIATTRTRWRADSLRQWATSSFEASGSCTSVRITTIERRPSLSARWVSACPKSGSTCCALMA